MFEVTKKDSRSLARTGFLTTEHGVVETPSYVMVGTHAEVRCLRPEDLISTKTQIIIVNTYHLWRRLGKDLKTFEGLHARMRFNGAIMTDSGGFQVFSLGFGREHSIGKIGMFPGSESSTRSPKANNFKTDRTSTAGKNLVGITEEGVYFMEGGERIFLDAELSLHIQEQLGADIILAFDECTSPLHDHEYTRMAMERTHAWALRGLKAKQNSYQKLYGIVQGGAFRDLREASAKFIGRLPFDGFAIGGPLGRSREDMSEVIKWTIPFLPDSKPRHLLGIGRIRDLFEAVELGIDTFDCVVPTREARHAALWTPTGRFQITKGRYEDDRNKIQTDCLCPTCRAGVSRSELYRLFKSRDPEAARLATIHNVYFFNDLMTKMRRAIQEDGFSKFKKNFLAASTV